jgi:hypothetical protein
MTRQSKGIALMHRTFFAVAIALTLLPDLSQLLLPPTRSRWMLGP